MAKAAKKAALEASRGAPDLSVAELQGMASPYNPRKIKPHDLAALRRSLRTFGAVEPVVVNRRTGRIVGGHQRVKAAHAEGIETLPVVYVDLAEPQEKQLNLALNRIAGEFDRDALAAVLQELKTIDADIGITGFTNWELKSLLVNPQDGKTDPNAIPAGVPRRVKVGDLWLLGEHRLFCGDSTQAAAVKRVMGGETADIMVTDPPYGVRYRPSWRNEAAAAGAEKCQANRVAEVPGDDRHDWNEAWALFGGRIAYVWHASWFIPAIWDGMKAAGLLPRALIIWHKSYPVISRGAYNWQHECLTYSVRDKKTAGWIGPKNETTIWENMLPVNDAYHNSDEPSTGHGAQKPLEAMERPIRNHDAPLVYDPFVGSGTTLIAAERLERKCFGIDIDPGYCDVALKRWEEFTGKKARKA